MTRLTLDGVSKRYDGTVALADVDLTVRDGEFFTLVGPSGCGKTTTLRTIAGFEEPTAGDVRFDGREMAGVPPERRDVGVVFQSYALFPHMSVAENVGYGLRFREPPEGTTVDERVAELLALVDLEGMGDRDPERLSGGQRQRVALARALAPAPDLLLLDEPMSALDARLRESLRRQVTRIQSELGITTIYVTHDQAEALAISDRLAVMADGRIEQVGKPQEIYREPATRFVAEFVGDNNVFDGRVRDRGRSYHGTGDGDGGDSDGDGDGGLATGDGEYARVAVDGEPFALPALPDVGDAERVTFCVRPGALSPTADRNRLTVTVETTEFLGETVRVNGRWNGSEIALRLPDVPDGDELTVGFAPEDVHVVSTR